MTRPGKRGLGLLGCVAHRTAGYFRYRLKAWYLSHTVTPSPLLFASTTHLTHLIPPQPCTPFTPHPLCIPTMINDYFNRNSAKWNLLDFCHHFLATAPEPQRTMGALSSAWTNSLDSICHDGEGKESRKTRKAQLLRQQWDQVC